MGSLVHKVTSLERQIQQLSHNIDSLIAKDRELLARLRSGQQPWRAIRRAKELSLHPYDEPSLPGFLAHQERDGSALTDETVVLSDKSLTEEKKSPAKGYIRDANSI